MQVQIINVVAGVMADGETQTIDNLSVEDAKFEFDSRKKTMRINIEAVVDFDALEFVLKFDDLAGMTVLEPEFDLDAAEFDLLSRDDTFKNEYWFSITEKNPGAHNMVGNYSVLIVEMERIHGDIHIYITIE